MKCLICGHETISYPHPKFNMFFHECERCQFIFKDEKNYPSIELEFQKYEEHQNDDDNQGYINFLTNFIDSAVIPFIKKGKALDFGSGPNPVLAKILSNQYLFDVDIYDYFYAPHQIYESKTYDLITSTEVVEHLSNPLKIFKLFYQHLNPNGILSILTLFHPNQREELFNWHYIRDITHLCFFTPVTMRKIAEICGFEFISTNHYRYTVFKKVF
jgi:SAM-dependent methyltransferase